MGAWFLPPLCLAVLVWFWLDAPSPRAAAWLGFLYGAGLFGGGVSWVYVSLHDFGMMPAALALAATALFCAYLALFPALAGSLQARFDLPPIVRAVVLTPVFWVLTEWLRGWVLTGFPWLAIGYSQTDTALAGFGPVSGVYGISLVTLVCAGALAAAFHCRAAATRMALVALALVLYGGGALLNRQEWTRATGAPIPVSVLQGNIEQEMKFDPARYASTLQTYRRLVEGSRGKLILLPETAIPRLLDTVDPAYLDALAAFATGHAADILVGAPFRDRANHFYNGVVNLGASGLQFFAKRHLVPLGEFVPREFGWIVSVLHIPLSDFSRADEQHPLRAAGERVAMTVCYEDTFGEELIDQLPEATLLANVSNVAWFGHSLAPEQHLQMARMRSIETGRYLLASTNTGVTAIVDQHGRVKAQLPTYREGRLEGEAQGFSGSTPYVRFGNAPVLDVCTMALLLCIAFAIRPRRKR